MTWLDAGPDDLADGGMVARLVGGRMVLLVRQGERLHATDGTCPHKFADLSEGTLGDGCLTCPQHEATFDLRTGLPGAQEGWAGRLPVHRVQSVDGRLQVQSLS